MAENIDVEFDLDPVALADLMKRRNEVLRQTFSIAVWVVLGVVGLLLGEVGPAILMFALAVLFAFLVLKMPKLLQSLALRSAGHTQVRFSDEGMDFRGANLAERVPWARIRRVYDRPNLWSFVTRMPVTTFLVPKSAVPAELREQLTAQLMDWSGPAYKRRKS